MKTFTKIYQRQILGKERGSGAGSSIPYNKRDVEFLEAIIHRRGNNIETILDLGYM